MPDERLTLVESCALLLLLREGREISNADLKNERGLELKKANRERLVELKLIDVRKEGQRLHLALSDQGWGRALEVIGTEPPPRSGYQGAAIYAQVAALRDYLEATGTPVSEYFTASRNATAGRSEENGEPPTVEAVTALIRNAYQDIAQAPDDPIKIARIRTALAHVRSTDVDAALVAMNRQAGVRIFAEANQKTLTAADRDAAVNIGNQDKHLIAIR